MKRQLRVACLLAASLIAPRVVAAQDVAITNARIIDGAAIAAEVRSEIAERTKASTTSSM